MPLYKSSSPSNSTIKSNNVGTKKIMTPAIALITKVFADFFISSSLLDNTALAKSILPKIIKIIGINIFKMKNTQPKVVNTPCTGPVQKVDVSNVVSDAPPLFSLISPAPLLPLLLLFVNLNVGQPEYC